MKPRHTRLGVDLGAMYVKAVRLDDDNAIVASFYERHLGELESAFDRALAALRFTPGDSIGVTGAADSAKRLSQKLGLTEIDLVRARIDGVRAVIPDVVEVLDIGGSSSALIQLDAAGKFCGVSENSLCAAGTGSFLDEQAARLGISLSDAAAFEQVKDPPSIAARCSVFAKSDLIHRQQEGYSKAAMWSGLCRGMTRTLLGTLLSGRPLMGKTAIIGGVAQNAAVIYWLRESCGELIAIPDAPHLAAARGAALGGTVVAEELPSAAVAREREQRKATHDWPLSMEKSVYPSFACAAEFKDEHGSEIRVLVPPPPRTIPVYLGIDIGSTSTKAVLIDDEEQVLVDIYRRTAGDPIRATKLLLRALGALSARYDCAFDIRGVGTTGSGRALVGKVIGADAIVNEISAHVAGAVKVDPSVDTIFEIGGQDAKYMHVVDGHIRDANMNYVCAAGTGSFIEEQANKLGIPVSEVGAAVLGLVPPRSSDRCTVFMEQDITALLQSGHSRELALASVMVAIVKNYLNKVVGNRHRSRAKIFFQGATARNPGLVAAFERLLDVQMVVSPYCHVMGSYGVALITRARMREQGKTSSSFYGLGFADSKVALRKETCTLCQNNCTITYADIEGVSPSPSFGYMCGRDPSDKRMRVFAEGRYLREREKLWRTAGGKEVTDPSAKVVGLPRALVNYTFAPLWRRFFAELGLRTKLSPMTTPKIAEFGGRLAGAEFCFPAKVAIGHAAWLAKEGEVDFIFIPQLGNERAAVEVNAATYCPYVQAWPAYVRTAFGLNGIDQGLVLAPLIDKRLPEDKIIDHLAAALASPLGRTRADIARAFRDANAAHAAYMERCYAAGDAALREAKARGERLLVLVGRPYNTFDMGINLDLPQKIAERGLTVLPMDFIRPDLSLLGERYRNVYWAYGQKILAVLSQVAKSDDLDAIYFTNFACGPDSFLLSYAEEIMGERPFLALELDEHGGDAGYLTRIEAFLDVVSKPRAQQKHRAPQRSPSLDFKQRTLFIPPMHELGADLFAAAFRRHGYRAEALPPEDAASFELGRSLTRGSECLPTALTIGAFISAMRARGLTRDLALLMPTACGPCRFGQYCQLHRQILDREGFADVAILSPSSLNAYQGVDDALRRDLFKAIVASDILLKARCKVRPYEKIRGETDRVFGTARDELSEAITSGRDLRAPIAKAVASLARVERHGAPKPKVGIVGEIYVRNNVFANEDLISSIEAQGGEAWPTPMAEWIMFLASPRNFMQYLERKVSLAALKSYVTYRWQRHWEHALYRAASPFLDDRREPDIDRVLDHASAYMERNIGGEAMSIIGRAVEFAKDGAALVVNCAPFGCMPGIITTALFRDVSARFGVPVVNMFYDGQGNQNRRLGVFLRNAASSLPPAPRDHATLAGHARKVAPRRKPSASPASAEPV